MYPTFECRCESSRFNGCNVETCDCACHCDITDVMAKPGDILEDDEGTRTLIRHHIVKHKHDRYDRPYNQHFILIDGDPTNVISQGGGVVFTPTLEAYYQWPPDEKLIRDGAVIYDGTPDTKPSNAA